MYVHAYVKQVAENEINISFVMGMMVMLYFVRMLLALGLNETLGPIITTIQYMFNDIAVFIVIWFIILLGFTLVGVLLF